MKSCRFDESDFSALYFFMHMFNVSNESGKYDNFNKNF